MSVERDAATGRLLTPKGRLRSVRDLRVGVAFALLSALACGGRAQAIDQRRVAAIPPKKREVPTCFVGDAVPKRLSETGCYRNLPKAEIAPSLVAYDVRASLYVEGAAKRRWLYTPEPLAFEQTGEARFPSGAVIAKEFGTPEGEGAVRPVETRFMIRRASEWRFATYVWNEAGDDAVLSDEPLETQTARPGKPPFLHRVPGERECRLCHSSSGPDALGVTLSQLSLLRSEGGHHKDQLDWLEEQGVLVVPRDLKRHPLVDYADEASPMDARARSYLHAQCAHCHRPGGFAPTGSTLDLRWGDALRVPACVRSRSGEPYVDPGHPESSLLWVRIAPLRGHDRMPLLGTTTLDPAAHVVEKWITSLPRRPCNR